MFKAYGVKMVEKIRKGDIVGRKSYNKDILFVVEKIIKSSNNKTIVLLKGLNIRIQADSDIEDLELIDKKRIEESEKRIENRFRAKLERQEKQYEAVEELKRSNKIIYTGKILHLDGDRRYSEKSISFYRKMGLKAVVKNVPESRQAVVVGNLIERYKPDILVVTGHDGMIKGGTGYYDIYNYRNSKYFIQAVKKARAVKKGKSDLVIFAGACQSYYEELINAGANFASSPARILIDFIDPLIIAERVATTDYNKYLTIRDIEDELRDGKRGVNGIGAKGKKKVLEI